MKIAPTDTLWNYHEGIGARLAGKDLFNNPYSLDSSPGIKWAEGWIQKDMELFLEESGIFVLWDD